MQDLLIALMLHDTKLRQDLPTECHSRLPVNGNMETTLAVDKSCNPQCF